ncbi:hypothetical protein LXL04_032227 [Taraxacum kok-saghyz]
MQTFQLLHLLIFISLTTPLIEAQIFFSKPRCSTRCGQVLIGYPFGIGSNCSANDWYTIDCNSRKAYLPALNNVEMLGLNMFAQTVTINISVIKVDCKNPVLDSNLILGASYSRSPFTISGSNNSLVVKGCGNGVLIENRTIVGGCSTTCGNQNDIVDDENNCFGVGCCQTAIPHDLKSFTLNLTGLEAQNRDGTCGSAFLVDITSLERLSLTRIPGQIIGDDYDFAPISLSWNESFNLDSTRCNETCGEFSIPYPFGIERNCSKSDWFNVDCNSSTPFLPAFNNLEVLDFGSGKETVTVNVPMVSDCDNPSIQNNNLLLIDSPFLFSKLDNIFVVEGCGSAAIMENVSIVSGCSTTCSNGTVSDLNNCFGVGCCQTTLPYNLESFYVNQTGLERQAGNGRCGSAYMVDMNSFVEGRFSRQFVPVTLVWPEFSAADSTECRLCELGGGFCNFNYLVEDGSYEIYCSNDPSSKESIGVILGVSISMGLLFLTAIGYALYKIIKKTKVKRRKQRCFKRNGGILLKQQEATNSGLVDKTILFTSKELEKATDYFSENRVLGRGGQGTVYKGMLADGRIVAIKKSKVVDESQLEQFINEVVILSQVNHRHVVKLLGCCLETEVPLLVSEFISNGTLYELIHDETSEVALSLNMRLQIATEIAGAVAYLHSATSIPIYHRDIKTTNILLDEKYRAKVSDFGTSRFVSIDQTHLTTLVKGTFGYLDPEYFQSSQFTEKSDVYSFGVVLLELLTREKPISLTRFGENRSLATHFLLAMEEGRVMSIFDPVVVKEDSRNELLGVANLAMRCLNFNGKHRPTMKEVAIELESIRSSHVPSKIQSNFGPMEHFDELPLTYGMSTSTTMS